MSLWPRNATGLSAARKGAAVSWLVWTFLTAWRSVAATPTIQPPVDFSREIKPILSDHCYACHGPDEKKRKAGLRLDLKDEALKPAKSGRLAIVPKDLEKSELVRRIMTSQEEDRMPPSKGAKPLSISQIATLKRWIDEGAVYTDHWAFIPPVQTVLPTVTKTDWPRGAIDAFVRQ